MPSITPEEITPVALVVDAESINTVQHSLYTCSAGHVEGCCHKQHTTFGVLLVLSLA